MTLSYRQLKLLQNFGTLLLVVMCCQWVWLEGIGVSPIKVSVMILSLLVYLLYCPVFSRAVVLGTLFWLVCFSTSFLHEYFRFDTVAYLGLFIIAFITLYTIVWAGVFPISRIIKILKYIVYFACIVLILQQICVLLGVTNFKFLNLYTDIFGMFKLPSITLEPSHTARILTACILGILKLQEIMKGHEIKLKNIFDRENLAVTICYLYTVLTMGSGTGLIGLFILALYFIRPRNFLYICLIVALLFGGLHLAGNKQILRLEESAKATLTGNVGAIHDADASAAVRIIPMVNTITKTDIFDYHDWVGKGTLSKEAAENQWLDMNRKIDIVEQYGLLGFLASLIFVYGCCIYRFFSLETLIYIFLLMFSIGNLYITWFTLYVFATIRYFKIKSLNVQPTSIVQTQNKKIDNSLIIPAYRFHEKDSYFNTSGRL